MKFTRAQQRAFSTLLVDPESMHQGSVSIATARVLEKAGLVKIDTWIAYEGNARGERTWSAELIPRNDDNAAAYDAMSAGPRRYEGFVRRYHPLGLDHHYYAGVARVVGAHRASAICAHQHDNVEDAQTCSQAMAERRNQKVK